MKNIVYIGKYTLNENFLTAEGKRVLNQVKYLLNRHEVFVITFSSQSSNYRFNLNFKTKEQKGFLDLLGFPFYWITIFWNLIKRKKKENFLLLESNVEIYSICPIFFAKILGYKIIHDVVEDFSLASNLSRNQKISITIGKWFQKNISKYCSGVIVISENLATKYNQIDLPIIKIYNSVDKQEYDDSDYPIETFNFFYSGSFNAKDGVLDLIEAFNFLSKKEENVHLYLTGRGHGQYFNDCLSKIKNNNKIAYKGFLPENEMFSYIKKSHVLCITRSNSAFANNGFPFKLAEYLSFGIPVLTTTVSDIALLLKNNENAFFAIPESVKSIAETMEKIILNYPKAIEIGKKGRLFCLENFSIEAIGSELEGFVERVHTIKDIIE
ncbi:glycosyltransferase family 4 protein [Lutimonas zeaxanthinifaciens]|uniref:glycosyltransferase family 4 protein n=1 Tax=Lutimonas zeaxanthinifaciens TaxID=3060215 RepID=UPI00265CF46A|nr:glycosyltransferase family 4 protein [Lutimonas sp. YSD2104]WKK66465.1 glycosyltransferase family 4 protein [Lutimonas sp. YSD2104]